MGDVNLGINYYILTAFTFILLAIYLLARNKLNLFSFLLYCCYTLMLIIFRNNNHLSLYKNILIHFFISTAHIIISIAINIILISRKKSQS